MDNTQFAVDCRNDVAGDGDGLWGKTIALSDLLSLKYVSVNQGYLFIIRNVIIRIQPQS